MKKNSEQQVRTEAAAWLTKHDRGLTAAEQDEFFQWLSTDPRHGVWFSVHKGNWKRLDGIANWRPKHGTEPNPDVLARSSLGTRLLRPTLLAVTGAAILATVGVFWFSGLSVSQASQGVGGYESRVLDDGSVVELNRDAEIEVNYSISERRVVLRHGEAFFTVAKNSQRPFIVNAQGAQVRAVGTAFNVKFDHGEVAVLVTEGKVAVAAPINTQRVGVADVEMPLVKAGESAVVSLVPGSAPQIALTSEKELERLRAWQPQLLDFSSVSLENVISEFNSRNRVKLILADPASGKIPIVASIRSDNIEGIVSLVVSATGLQAERRGNYEIVLRPAK